MPTLVLESRREETHGSGCRGSHRRRSDQCSLAGSRTSMDFTTTSNKGHAFLKVVLLMRCESDTLRTLVRAGDTVGAV